jgi:leader peptidase (prepilin peptidase)/N-methyltransferase
MAVIVQIFFFLLGSAIGSFLNVCIYRIPREKSVVSPPSACPGCDKPIRSYDNIPIISYIMLHGKCRDCAIKISSRYPFVEFLTAVLFLVTYRSFGKATFPFLTFELVVFLILVSLLITISFIDLDFQIIPDVLSIGGIILGFLLSIARPLFRNIDPKFGILDSLYGIVLGGGLLFVIAWLYQWIAKRDGMGGGDIKLLGMIGAFCGWQGVLFSLISGSVLGTVVGIPLMLAKGSDTKYAIPFGPFLSLGALVYVFAGNTIIRSSINFLTER